MTKPSLARIGRVAVTVAAVALAAYAARSVWIHYQVEPWTPDGRVRADIVQIAPDIAGTVTELWVANDQPVKRGQPLFQIDRERYTLALREAEANVATRRAHLTSPPRSQPQQVARRPGGARNRRTRQRPRRGSQ